MISKGNTHADGAKLADYMTTGKANERAELWDLRGFGMGNIADAFRTVHVMAEATNCEQPFFHVQVRNRDGELLTRRQWEHTADRIDGMLGLKDQPRAIAFHIDEKTGHEHMHVAWSRIDENTMTARPLPFFKDRLKKLSRELERHFALEPVTNQREGDIKFAPTRAEHEQARRLGQNVHELRNMIRECWDRADCGRSFQGALEHEGFTLAQGDRRGYVVIDRAGGLHPLGKRILDMTAAKIRDRFSDLSADDLPTVETVRAFLEEARHEIPQQPEQKENAPCWDRDAADRAWQDAVINAAIAKETADDEPIQKNVGNRKKEWPIHPPTPETIETSPECFVDVAQATTHRTEEPKAGITSQIEHIPTKIPAAKPIEFALPKDNRKHNEVRRKIRSFGLYEKALQVTGIVRRQFRQLASLLTGHAPAPEREAQRGTTASDGSTATPTIRYTLPPEAYAAVEILSETLDWMNPWHNETAFAWENDEDFQQTEHDPFYPQP